MKRYLFIVAVLIAVAACEDPKRYQRLDDGVIVTAGKDENATKVRVKILSDNIVRLTATPADSFSTTPSLMVAENERPPVEWTLIEREDKVSLRTNSLIVNVSLSTGAVTFTDTAGTVILDEKQGGGKTFTPVAVDGKKYYSIRQEFESPDDEAFYGLGGHQHGQMNYKGQDVELVQHNIVDVIPFLYSSKNYGILWDNYSITKFGDIRDYQPLSSINLFTASGEPGGLTATYYDANNKVIKSVVENTIGYEYLETPQVDSFPKNVKRIVWEGALSSSVTGIHKFLVYASGYFKVWIDGELIMDKWRQNWNPWSNKFTVEMDSDQKHTLRVEWVPDGGYMAVKHLDPLNEQEQNRLSLFSEVAGEIDYYFIKGDDADEVISGYRNITGKAPIMPAWSMGFWQSRERYKTQEELVGAVKEFRKRKIPLDNIVLDWFYWPEDKWGSHQFDPSRFPDPKRMMTQLHDELHARLMISVWPKFYPGTDNFEEMQKAGYLFQRNLDAKRLDWVGPGYRNTFYDPFNAGGRKLFWDQINRRLNVLGIDAWWLDATEPDMHSNISIDARKENMSPTALGPGAQYFNAYSLMNSKGIYEEQRKTSPEKRVFILTRSAYAGQQRYGAATWSGDIVSRWSDMKDQISVGINFSLSGIPYWTMDIGGFSLEQRYVNPNTADLDEWRELNTRWYQFGAFCPLFRVHGQFPFREVFNIAPEGHPAYQSMLYYNRLRYRLMPYIYSLAGLTYHSDYTIMRGLVMDFGTDSNVRNINDQYMFGPALLINPVYEYKARSRSLYLPAGAGWYDVYTGKYYQGGQTINADAPLATIPVFAKAGSILPAGPDLQYVNEKPADPVTLYVFTGKDARFTLYEDEGINYNYENGAYTTIPISYSEQAGTLTIGERTGSFTGMLQNRTFQVIWVMGGQPVGLNSPVKPAHVVRYDGKPVTVNVNR